MASVATGFRGFRVFLEMIKIEHSVFALPFAMLGMLWAADGWPGWRTFCLIVMAMISCRSAAMAFNRIADRRIDAQNPRTSMRAIPAGLLQLRTANLYFYGSLVIFGIACWLLNPLALALCPVAVFITLGYSLTKRFTPLCHLILGFSLGIAPAAAWIAVTGSLAPQILWLTAAVTFWTAGFDIIYSLQDSEFDKQMGLKSIPQTLGPERALFISRCFHIMAVCFLMVSGLVNGSGPTFALGVVVAAALLIYEQSLVKPRDLSKVNLAFFTLNGFVSIGIFLFGLLDWWFRHRG